jgi:rhodanese-related sulfurtransferase
MNKLKALALIFSMVVFISINLIAQDTSGTGTSGSGYGSGMHNYGMYSDSTGMNQDQAGAKELSTSKSISAKQFRMMMQNDTSLVVLDVRNPEDMSGSSSTISPKSINIPLKDLDTRISELNSYTGRTIAIIGKNDNSAEDAQKILTQHGFVSKRVRGGADALMKMDSQ